MNALERRFLPQPKGDQGLGVVHPINLTVDFQTLLEPMLYNVAFYLMAGKAFARREAACIARGPGYPLKSYPADPWRPTDLQRKVMLRLDPEEAWARNQLLDLHHSAVEDLEAPVTVRWKVEFKADTKEA